MPYWKWSEFESYLAQRPEHCDVEIAREVFDIYGGCFRYVVNKPVHQTIEQLKHEMKMLIYYFKLERLFSYWHLETSEMIMKVLHFEVDDDFACNSVRFASQFVLNYVARTKESELRDLKILPDDTFYQSLLVALQTEVNTLKEAAEKADEEEQTNNE